jgi:hypothetical protein
MKTVHISIVLTFLLTSSTAFASDRDCIRAGFRGNILLFTNLCSSFLMVIWSDDNGEHDTAIGRSGTMAVGTVHGAFQIDDVRPQ